MWRCFDPKRCRNLAGAAAALVFAVSILAGCAGLRSPSNDEPFTTGSVDSGGAVVTYALNMLKLKRSGAEVRFTGRCASACTLYLALPRHQTCIARGASFRFHSPYASSSRGNEIARAYLLKNYPGWVRTWIDENGGLSDRMIVMDYNYAKKFMRVCEGRTSTA
jgi:hypothetical protein